MNFFDALKTMVAKPYVSFTWGSSHRYRFNARLEMFEMGKRHSDGRWIWGSWSLTIMEFCHLGWQEVPEPEVGTREWVAELPEGSIVYHPHHLGYVLLAKGRGQWTWYSFAKGREEPEVFGSKYLMEPDGYELVSGLPEPGSQSWARLLAREGYEVRMVQDCADAWMTFDKASGTYRYSDGIMKGKESRDITKAEFRMVAWMYRNKPEESEVEKLRREVAELRAKLENLMSAELKIK